MNSVRRAAINTSWLCFIITGCGAQPGDENTPRTTPPEVSINSDVASRHYAQIVTGDGITYDYWVERGADNSVLQLTNLRVRANDDTEHLLEWDSQGRAVFYRHPSGSSVRVHSFLTDGGLDLTITLPDGRTVSGILAPNMLPLDEDDSRFREISDAPKWLASAQSNGTIAGACETADRLTTFVCTAETLYGLIKLVVGVGTCMGAIAIDIITIPTVAESIAGCVAGQAIAALTDEIVSTIVCGGLQVLFETCVDAFGRPLGEDEPPGSVMVPPTEAVSVIRIGQQSSGIPTSSRPPVIFRIGDEALRNGPAQICVRSARSLTPEREPLDSSVTRCFLYTVDESGMTRDAQVGECNGGQENAENGPPPCFSVNSATDEIHFVVTVDDLAWTVLTRSPYEIIIEARANDGSVIETYDPVLFHYQAASVVPE